LWEVAPKIRSADSVQGTNTELQTSSNVQQADQSTRALSASRSD
jgi:hypothetical protein